MLNEISKSHHQFIQQLSFLGCPEHLREDFVQDMYIKVYEASKYREIEYKKAFASLVLRNMYFDFCKKKKREIPSDYLENTNIVFEELDIKEEQRKSDEMDSLFEVIPDFTSKDFVADVKKDYGVLNGYELSILILHYKEEVTMRSLAKESGITLSSIYNTIKKAKLKLKKAINEKQRTRRHN